jgi:hypothetical protein
MTGEGASERHMGGKPKKGSAGGRVFSAVSLFCGAGGLDIGFERAGFATIWGNDFDRDSCATHRL